MLVAGGFYDEKSVIVEPLSNPLHMLMGVEREGALAQVLYALQKGFHNIHLYVPHPSILKEASDSESIQLSKSTTDKIIPPSRTKALSHLPPTIQL